MPGNREAWQAHFPGAFSTRLGLKKKQRSLVDEELLSRRSYPLATIGLVTFSYG